MIADDLQDIMVWSMLAGMMLAAAQGLVTVASPFVVQRHPLLQNAHGEVVPAEIAMHMCVEWNFE
jgi:hypothetical protein